MRLLHATVAAGITPFQEIPVAEYFPPLKNFTPAPASEFVSKAQIPRFTKITQEQFEELSRSGQPFVVDDCVTEHPLMGKSCDDFGKLFPNGKMKANYGDQIIKLSEKTWSTKARMAKGEKQHLSKGVKIADPYVWHVKDEETRATKSAVQRHWGVPYFLNTTLVNNKEVSESFEMWFAISGGGAMAHSDSYTLQTVSAQFSGSKKWRLMMFPDLQTVFESFNEFDRGVYEVNRWAPEYEFEVGPGQCVIFPPAYMHETFADPKDNPSCSASTTFQYVGPFPSRYLRNFLSRFTNSHLASTSYGMMLWGPYATIEAKSPKCTTDTALIAKRARNKMGQLDGDKDGGVTEAELEQFFLSKKGEWGQKVPQTSEEWFKGMKPEGKKQVNREMAKYRAGDVLAWHDLDRDGKITLVELEKTFTQWNVLLTRHNELKAIRKQKKDKKVIEKTKSLEEKYATKYRCGSEGGEQCPLIDSIKSKKGKSYKSIRWFLNDGEL